MKFGVFYLQFINSLEGLGMFFSSAALIRKLRSYAATTTIGSKDKFGTKTIFGQRNRTEFRIWP